VGALDYPDEERKELARRSLSWSCPKCGSCNATALPSASACLEQPPEPKMNEKLGAAEESSTTYVAEAGARHNEPQEQRDNFVNPNNQLPPTQLQDAQQGQDNSPNWLNWLIILLLAGIIALLLRKNW